MPLAIREPHDLVFERRTVARTDAADLPVVERTLVDVLLHQLAHAIVRVKQPAADLVFKRRASAIRKRSRLTVAALFDEDARRNLLLEIDAASMRAAAGFRSSAARPRTRRPGSTPQALRDGGSPCPSGGTLLASHVDQAVQKSACRDHQRRTQDAIAAFESEAVDPAVFDKDSASPRENPLDIGLAPNCCRAPTDRSAACLPAPSATRRRGRDFDSAA